MIKIVILGASGFTGRHFIKYILDKTLNTKYSFIGYDIYEPIEKVIPFHTLNLLEDFVIDKIICTEKPDYILNFIGKFGTINFEELFSTNVIITKNIFESIIKNCIPIKNVLLIGSAAEYGNSQSLPIKETHPLNPAGLYGLTKVFQTYVARYYYENHQTPFTIARTFNIIGNGLSSELSIGSFMLQIEQAKDGDTIFIGNTETKRDIIKIDVVVDYYWKLLLYGKPGEIYNVCSGQSVAIRSLLEELIVKSGKKLKITVDKNRIKNRDIYDSYGDNSKLSSFIQNIS